MSKFLITTNYYLMRSELRHQDIHQPHTFVKNTTTQTAKFKRFAYIDEGAYGILATDSTEVMGLHTNEVISCGVLTGKLQKKRGNKTYVFLAHINQKYNEAVDVFISRLSKDYYVSELKWARNPLIKDTKRLLIPDNVPEIQLKPPIYIPSAAIAIDAQGVLYKVNSQITNAFRKFLFKGTSITHAWIQTGELHGLYADVFMNSGSCIKDFLSNEPLQLQFFDQKYILEGNTIEPRPLAFYRNDFTRRKVEYPQNIVQSPCELSHLLGRYLHTWVERID